jgi:hypothetical protein
MAGQLSVYTMVQFLNAALTRHDSDPFQDCMYLLLAHPVARQLSSDMVAQLLQTACTQGNGTCTAMLCELPAAASISSSQLVPLFEAAVNSPMSVQALLQLQNAKQLSRDVEGGMVAAAVSRGHSVVACAQSVCIWPALGSLVARRCRSCCSCCRLL